jgi:hypothetical protein
MAGEIVGEIAGAGVRALGDDDDVMALASCLGCPHILGHGLQIHGTFWNHRQFRTRRDGRHHRQIARIASHHFDQKGALM